nr:unnamed protein product [Naegleria fowleri]
MLQPHSQQHHLSSLKLKSTETNHGRNEISFIMDETSCHDEFIHNRDTYFKSSSTHRNCLMKEDIHTLVKIILMDFSNNNTSFHHPFGNNERCMDELLRLKLLLKKKFILQQKGKKKWLLNRELKYEGFIPIEFINDKQFVLNHIKKYGYGLGFASSKMKEDREFVLQVVQLNGDEIRYASFTIHNDKEVVLEAIKKEVDSFRLAPEKLRKDKKFVLEAIRLNDECLFFSFF